MGSILQEELKQSRPFANKQEETWLNLQRTAAKLSHAVETQLRPHGLSPTQYNVLRILRGAGQEGLCQYEIAERLVAQVPDVPRIVGRMVSAGWVKRTRGVEDRRMVMASLTLAGLVLVRELDAPLQAMMAEMFKGISPPDLQKLNDLLVAGRGGSPVSQPHPPAKPK